MNTIKWAVLGTGKIAHTFAEALKGCADAELYAVSSRSLEKAEKFAEEYGFAKAYGDYAEMARDNEIDVIYIASPMASHYENAMTCLKAGRNVLCEKSIGLNYGQAEKMISFAKEKKLFFMEAMWMKCRPVYLKVKEWAESGKIGDIRYIKADFSNYIQYDENDRLFRLDCGGGALLDLGVYPLTFAEAFLGMPNEVISSAHIGKDGVDLSNTMILRYDDGKFVSADNGFELQLSNNAIISGTDGFITMGNWFHCTCEAKLFDREAGIVESVVCENEINGYEYEIREVHRCLREGLNESPLVPHKNTLNVMKLMDTCREQWKMKFIGE